MIDEAPERPTQPAPRRHAGAWLAAMALLGPVALILAWYALVMAVGVASRGTVWPLGGVFVVAGAAGLVWFADRNRIRRWWTAAVVAAYAAATAFWAITLFLVVLSISCGDDGC